mgnify:CR=1 FL=1
MKRIIIIAICSLFLIACSSPKDRREEAKEISKGEVIHQAFTNTPGASDCIIIKRENCLIVTFIDEFGDFRSGVKFCNMGNYTKEMIYE